jgi:ribonuclease VapC
MFIDAFAIVAILTRELDADALLDLLEAASAPITAPVAVFEAVPGLCRKRHARIEEAEADLRAFLGLAEISVVAITDQDTTTALRAFSRYGKGQGHPAQFDPGDCFA